MRTAAGVEGNVQNGACSSLTGCYSACDARPVIVKAKTDLKHQAVAFPRTQSLMETENILRKAVAGLAFQSLHCRAAVGAFDLRVHSALLQRNKMPQLLSFVTAADIYMGAAFFVHVRKIEKECQGTIAIDVVMEGLAAFALLVRCRMGSEAPPHASPDQD